MDSGATSLFLDRSFVCANHLTMRSLLQPIPVYNVDGAPNNPEVDWTTKQVKMSRCPSRCTTCQTEVKWERKALVAEAEHIHACRAGLMPEIDDDLGDVPEIVTEDNDDDEDDADVVQEGDPVFMTCIRDAEEVCATSTTSQRLAEAFGWNSAPPRTFRDGVPPQFHNFEDVFAKELFDALPSQKQWDHTIELQPEAQSSNCKVYPLSPKEQTELDDFIRQNLATGRIRPLKSPMASLVFFIKKKDGTLRLIQDYRNLNVNTVKN